MRKVFNCTAIFLAGFVACANLSRLIGVNPDYSASYVKVFVSVVLAIFFMITIDTD